MITYTTEWTGHWPCLCFGDWKLYKDGELLLDADIPFQGEPAYTFGEYRGWHFVNHSEEWYYYEDGLSCGEWITQHRDWLSSFAPEEDFEKIYSAFQANDWRYNSCMGCV